MRMVLAATNPNEQLFYVVDPEKEFDGVVMSEGTVKYVPFWSYVNRDKFTRLTGTEFLNRLWVVPQGDGGEWTRKFFTREEPFDEEDLDSVELLLVNVPEEREPAE